MSLIVEAKKSCHTFVLRDFSDAYAAWWLEAFKSPRQSTLVEAAGLHEESFVNAANSAAISLIPKIVLETFSLP